MDNDNNGTLDLGEIESAIKDSGIEYGCTVELTKVLQEMDFSGTGLINYTQFLAATMNRRQYLQYEAVKSAFDLFDVDQDGRISREDLHRVAESAGEDQVVTVATGVNAAEIERIFIETDTDGDGWIDLEEFMAMMLQANDHHTGDDPSVIG